MTSKKKRHFPSSRTKLSRNIFIVHGREYRPMKELKILLRDFGLNPVVLHEQPSASRTLVEKLEKYSDVGFAFVILTPDDAGVHADKAYKELAGNLESFPPPNVRADYRPLVIKLRQLFVPRARQNVILEFGYFIGLLGRDRVCCLYKGGVELPSDMQGIVYIPFRRSIDEITGKIKKELVAAGYKIKTVLPEKVEKAIEDARERIEVETERLKDIGTEEEG